MSYVIRPAQRSESKPLIGLYARSGCGKTWSALMLARGFVGPTGRIVMIETEGGRGEAFCDLLPGGYDVCPIRGSFSPKAYGEALTAVETNAPDALIIDSASHEWEGADGVLAMAAKNQAAGKHGPLIWQEPKMEHQRHFMLRLMATPIPLVVVCMRAKYPMEEKPKQGGGKEWIRSTELEPKQSEDILFEMFVHGWIDAAHKFHGTKYTRDDFKAIIHDDEPITYGTGERLAAWACGGTTQEPVRSPARGERVNAASSPDEAKGGAGTPPASVPADGRVKEQILHEIVQELQKAHPSRERDDQEAKARLLNVGFGTRQWAKIQPLPSDTLKAGLEKIRANLRQSVIPEPEPVVLPATPIHDSLGGPVMSDEQELHAVMDRWNPPIAQEKRGKLFTAIFGTDAIDNVDWAALQDAIELFKRVEKKDPEAVAEVNRYLGRAA